MSNVLFILSGSIACYKACDAISQLVQRGHAVRAVATQAALKFVGVATLEGITRTNVGTDLFAPGEALEHITLSRWADATVVCPATAHTLNRMSAGLGEDLAGALLLAHDWKKPLLLVPAMNPAMWTHPATVESIERLRGWGARIIQPGTGRTACGEVGEGRLAEPAEIVAAVESVLVRPPRRLRILITSGGTTEPIDGVRVLTNTSTGLTGALIADHFARTGHNVTVLRATQAARPSAACTDQTFTTFTELDAALDRMIRGESFDAVIHAAAVSDFSVDAVEVNGAIWMPTAGKIPSDAAPTIRLRRNAKLLDSIRARSANPSVRIVAFKLTRDAAPDNARAAVEAIASSGAADFIVHNDLANRSANGAFPADVWNADGTLARHCPDRVALATALEQLISSDVSRLQPVPTAS